MLLDIRLVVTPEGKIVGDPRDFSIAGYMCVDYL